MDTPGADRPLPTGIEVTLEMVEAGVAALLDDDPFIEDATLKSQRPDLVRRVYRAMALAKPR